MAKRGSRRGQPRQARTAGNALYRELHKAIQLLDNEEYLEARDSLKKLHQEYPENETVLRKLIKACLEIKDNLGAQYALEQLGKLAPDDRGLDISLATCYLCNLKMTLALRLYRRFLKRWPEDELAPQIEKVVAELEPLVFRYLHEAGFTEDEFYELGALHDESQILMEYGQYADGCRVAEELIERKPKLTAPRNNLSLMYAMDGKLDKAITIAQETLELDPDNFHALSNLVRFHVQCGWIDLARQYAERLEPVVNEKKVEICEKKLEALSYLGDDLGVLTVFSQAQKSIDHQHLKHKPRIFHYVAVAEMRLGNEDRARQLWRQALDHSPGLEVARDNLRDLGKHAGERHAPWPFPVGSWISQELFEELSAEVESAGTESDSDEGVAFARRLLTQHPEFEKLIPIFLDRGDPICREMAMFLAAKVGTPETLEALRDFGLSRRGPDKMRIRACEIVREKGLLPDVE